MQIDQVLGLAAGAADIFIERSSAPRGRAGPNFLATIVFEKYGQHQPLNRQRDRYACEDVDLSLSTLADQVGACTVALRPLLADLKGWMQAERKKLSRHSPVAKAMDYMLRRWDPFARSLTTAASA